MQAAPRPSPLTVPDINPDVEVFPMSVARIASRAQLGLHAPLVHVEVHLGAGLPSFRSSGWRQLQ